MSATFVETCYNDIKDNILSTNSYDGKVLTILFMTDGEPSDKTNIVTKTTEFGNDLQNAFTNKGIRSQIHMVGMGDD